MLNERKIRKKFGPWRGRGAHLALRKWGGGARGVTDTIMVGRLPDSEPAIGAVSLGSTLFYTIGIFGSGIMLGMDTLVAQAYGAGRIEEFHKTMCNSLYLACAIAPVLMVAMRAFPAVFPHIGLSPDLVAQT